jgi:hypothetical protein
MFRKLVALQNISTKYLSVYSDPPHCPTYLHDTIRKARGGADVWSTALQAGRSRVRFPMESLRFFIDLILPAAYRNEYKEHLLGVKGGQCLGLTTLPPCRLSTNPGSLNLLETYGAVQTCIGIALPSTYGKAHLVWKGVSKLGARSQGHRCFSLYSILCMLQQGAHYTYALLTRKCMKWTLNGEVITNSSQDSYKKSLKIFSLNLVLAVYVTKIVGRI